MKQSVRILFVLFWSIQLSFAGGVKIKNVKNFNEDAFKPIMVNNQLNGYMLFYQYGEKKKDLKPVISIYDEDLKRLKSIQLKEVQSDNVFLKACGNGQVFSVMMFNPKLKKIEILAYDKELEKKRSTSLKLSKNELKTIRSEGAMALTTNIYEVPGIGFLKQGVGEKSSDITVQLFDNDLKVKWKYSFKRDMDKIGAKIGYFVPTFQDQNFICGVLTITRRGLLIKNECYVTAINTTNGKVAFFKLIDDKEYKHNISSIKYDSTSTEFTVIGEYFKNTLSSTGFFCQKYNEQGEIKLSQHYEWNGKFAAMVNKAKAPADVTGDKYKFYIHDVIRDDVGNSFIIMERYKKAISGKAVAVNIGTFLAMSFIESASGGAISTSFRPSSNYIMNFGSMVVVRINGEGEITDIHSFAKTKSSMYLPGGVGFLPSNMFGPALKRLGGFDYKFCTQSEDLKSFNLFYLSDNKTTKKADCKLLGVIQKSERKYSKVETKIPNESKTDKFVYPAADGQITVGSHQRKLHEATFKVMSTSN